MTNERIAFNPFPDLTIEYMGEIRTSCTGPNRHCRAAHKAGHSVHIISPKYVEDNATLALNTCHYVSIDDAIAAYNDARANARVVYTRTARDKAYARNETIWVSRNIDLNA